jgi:hypothetical protein
MTPASSSAGRDCARLLHQGRDLIASLSSEDYACASEAEIWASPGAHLRHVIDYFDRLLTGIDACCIDYTARQRCVEVEHSRVAALRELDRCIESLTKLEDRDERCAVEVRSDEDEPYVGSTLARELRFVASHTVHHFALIRLTLARRGIATPRDLGVSPSTLAHRARTRGAGA